MTDRAELRARVKSILATRPSWTLVEYEQAVIAALEAKPERTVGNIQDFKEMLRNQENDSSSLRITLGDFKQIAKALMASEPKCKTCKDTHTVLKGIKVIECGCGGSIRACSLCKGYGVYQQDTIADCPDCKEPAKPLPESEKLDWLVHDWIKSAVGKPLIRDEVVHWFRKVFDKIDELHSQHQAELELLRSKLALVLRENRRLSNELKKVDAEMEAAKEQGRQEALQAASRGLIRSAVLASILRSDSMAVTIGSCDAVILACMIESARDAQECGGG